MKISIAIPTRSRSTYLKGCLQSVLIAADAAECPVEIIVSDNASDDDTQAVVASFGSDKIIYDRLEQRVSMRQNFENALSLTTGSHVIFIGDDDGIVPNGLRILEELIKTYQSEIIGWRSLNFKWPNDEMQVPGHLVVRPMKLSGRVRQIDPKKARARFFAGKHRSYYDGGMIYHGCVSRKLIDRVRDLSQGTYFWCSSPDIHSSITNLLATQKPMLKIDRPISIGGASPRSNGDSGVKFAHTGNKEGSKEFMRFIDESRNDPFHSRVSDQCMSIDLHILGSLELACKMQNIPFEFNRKNWMTRIEKEIATFSPGMITACEQNLNSMFDANISIKKSGKTKAPDTVEAFEGKMRKMIDAPGSVKHSLSKTTVSGGTQMSDIVQAARFLDDLVDNSDLHAALHPSNPLVGARRLQKKLKRLG